jgi:uncharacterized protein YecE (DUF72 family)
MKSTIDADAAIFTCVRWLGDRKGIEEQTKSSNEVTVSGSGDLAEWAEILGKVHKQKIQIFCFANNNYAGRGPATRELLSDWFLASNVCHLLSECGNCSD